MPFNQAAAALGGVPRYTKTITHSGNTWKRSVDGTVADDGRAIPTDRRVHLTLIFSSCQWQSNTTAVASVEIDQIDSRSTIALQVNNADILGRGGNGGAGGESGPGQQGGNGGVALRLNVDCRVEITNGTGFIFGGGGGGGGGGVALFFNPVEGACDFGGAGSGGGGGAGGGSGGSSSGQSGSAGTGGRSGTAGAGGTLNADGGAGGAYGANGTAGATSTSSGGCPNQSGGSAGTAGKAIQHNASTTIVWISGNDSTHVKGAVGT